jgi:hypothetical protein
MFVLDLIADGGEILRLRRGDAAPQVEQRVREGLQDDFLTALDKGDPVTFFKVQGSPDRAWNSHLAAAAYPADDHLAYLHMPAVPVFAWQMLLYLIFV